ncbi:MAG: WYL domain-containing protein [Bacteriovoracaceae bacterium]|nr:WYL domain-containing protein [Bacteriovoracaceae bacterium]
MAANAKLLDNEFWKILSTLDSLNQDVSLVELCHHFGAKIKEEDVLEVLTFMRKFDFPLKAQKRDGNTWLCFTGKKPRVSMELSLAEWLAFQAHFPLLDSYEGKEIYNTLATRMKRVEARHPEFDLYKVMEEEEEMNKLHHLIPKDQEQNLNEINEAILNSELLILKTGEKSKVEVFPHKVVFLDGVLSLIAEDTNDRCMVCLEFQTIESSILVTGHRYKANFVGQEIDDFIMAIRSITGNEERLVMRISAPEKVNLKPQFHFLGSPYVTTNTEGEFIWAASVEVSEELFKWIESIKDEVEILDPQEVKDEFEAFLSQKQPLKPLKKAS